MAHFSSAVVALSAMLAGTSVMAAPAAKPEPISTPRDYTAVYKVLRKDKRLAAVTISLSHQQDVWTLYGFSHDPRGLAKFLNIKGMQTTIGTWRDGKFRPDSYAFSFSLIGFRKSWQALFDWQAGNVEIRGKHDTIQLTLDGATTDPFSLGLNLRAQLFDSQSEKSANEVNINIVDESRIEHHVYRLEPQGRVDTPLGCIDITLVRRVRANSKRVSLGWYARDYQFVPIRIQHKNRRGANLELLLVSLEIDGTPVQPTAACQGQEASGNSVRKPSAWISFPIKSPSVA